MRKRKLIRLRGYDYSRDNLYFVTSCVHNMICCFGEIVCTGQDQNMVLNEFGKIAVKQWNWLHEQYPYVVLHEFVVMPNHIHGIIEINRLRMQQNNYIGLSSIKKVKSLSELMGAYKTTVSSQIHLNGYLGFAWQRSFYETIIRNEIIHCKISDYIVNNPAKWNADKFYVEK
jgi:putative transposase